MKQLVKKEWREWRAPVIALFVLLCAGWCTLATVTGEFLAPSQTGTLVTLVTGCLAGLLLGYGQIAIERSRGTLAFLGHREGGRRALLEAKALSGASFALALAVLPPLVGCAWHFFGALGPIVQPERGLEHAWAGLVALPAYACGLVIALLAPGMASGLLLAFVAAVGCFSLAMRLPMPALSLSRWAYPGYALGQVGIAVAIGLLARALFTRGHDRDGTLPLKLQVHSVLFGLYLIVLPAWTCLGTGVRLEQQKLFLGFPVIVRSSDGSYATMGRQKFEQGTQASERTTFTLPDGTTGAVPDPAMVYAPRAPFVYPERLREEPWSRSPRWIELVSVSNRPNADLKDKDGNTLDLTFRRREGDESGEAPQLVFFDREAGIVRQFCGISRNELPVSQRRGEIPSAREVDVRRPDGRSLGEQTVLVTADFGAPLFVDREDWTLWALDFSGPAARLVPLEFPGGERLVAIEPGRQWEPEGWTTYLMAEPVLVGERSRFEWRWSGFVREDTAQARDFWPRYARAEFGEASLTSMTVRLRTYDANGRVDSSSKVAYEHSYEPESSSERALAVALRVGLLGGPPIFSAGTLVDWSSSALWMPRDRDSTHILHLVLGLLLGAWAWMHLARRGATLAERLLWGAFVALFGLFAFLFLLVLRPKPIVHESPALERASKESFA